MSTLVVLECPKVLLGRTFNGICVWHAHTIQHPIIPWFADRNHSLWSCDSSCPGCCVKSSGIGTWVGRESHIHIAFLLNLFVRRPRLLSNEHLLCGSSMFLNKIIFSCISFLLQNFEMVCGFCHYIQLYKITNLSFNRYHRRWINLFVT